MRENTMNKKFEIPAYCKPFFTSRDDTRTYIKPEVVAESRHAFFTNMSPENLDALERDYHGYNATLAEVTGSADPPHNVVNSWNEKGSFIEKIGFGLGYLTNPATYPVLREDGKVEIENSLTLIPQHEPFVFDPLEIPEAKKELVKILKKRSAEAIDREGYDGHRKRYIDYFLEQMNN